MAGGTDAGSAAIGAGTARGTTMLAAAGNAVEADSGPGEIGRDPDDGKGTLRTRDADWKCAQVRAHPKHVSRERVPRPGVAVPEYACVAEERGGKVLTRKMRSSSCCCDSTSNFNAAWF